MPIVKRIFILKCESEELCHELVEKIIENVPLREATYQVQGNVIKVTIVGLKHDVQNAWSRIKELYRETLRIKRTLSQRGLKTIPVSYLVKSIKRTFPPDVLVLALTLKGSKAEKRDNEIVTNAEINNVILTAKKIADAIDKLKFRTKGTATKKAIACLSAILNIDVDEIIDVLKKLELVVEEEEKVKVKKEWRSVVKEVISKILSKSLEV